MSVRLKRKRNVIASSESESNLDENDDNKDSTDDILKPRLSTRIAKKRSKRFSLPTRDSIWNEIPDLEKPITSLRHFTPKKTRNDFTKVYNAYNFDDFEDTGDESDGIGKSSSDSDDVGKKKHRIKNYHPRVAQAGDSSEESDTGDSPSQRKAAETDEEPCTSQNKLAEVTSYSQDDECVDIIPHLETNINSDSDSDAVKTPRRRKSKKFKRRRKRLSLDSDEESVKTCKEEDSVQASASSINQVSTKELASKVKGSSENKDSDHKKQDSIHVSEGNSSRLETSLQMSRDKDCEIDHTDDDVDDDGGEEKKSDDDSHNEESDDESESVTGSQSCHDDSDCDEENEEEEEDCDQSQSRSDLLKRKRDKEKTSKFKDFLIARKQCKKSHSCTESLSASPVKGAGFECG